MTINGIKTEHRITALEISVKELKEDFMIFTSNHFEAFKKENQKYHDEMIASFDKIKSDIANRFPIWVTIIITLLSSLVVGLMVNSIK